MSEIASSARLDAVAVALGHRFADEALLLKACTHASSCAPQATATQRLQDANERLEFVGDALLGAALCVMLLEKFPDASEGRLSRLKARLVSRTALARIAERTQLLTHCLIGAQMREPWPDSVKANLMESLLAAVHLDGGWPALQKAVMLIYAEQFAAGLGDEEDAKTKLQEWCLAQHRKLPTYSSERSGGSDHSPEFTARVSIGEHAASASGSSRRRAEAAAAADLLCLIEGADDVPAQT
jgi:ribonuclease-3